ncbi:ribonuclease Z [Candidatus Pacearchaeota archaeon]|nr:ribonuclease Z [Candidatus Pacearchaeota archaeon]
MSEKIEVVFLGTGSAMPTARKNHQAVWIKFKGETLLFDCGEGTQRQIRIAKLNPCKITRIFISHWHGDHILGIPGLLWTLALSDYKGELEVYIPKGTKRYMDTLLNFFVFVGKINISVREVDRGVVFENKDFKIIAERMQHTAKCLGYSFVEKDMLRIDKKKLKKLKIKPGPELAKIKLGKDVSINGKKIKAKSLTYEESGRKITIIPDTLKFPLLSKFADKSDLLISESSFLDEIHLAEEKKHLTSIDAAQIANKSKSKKLFLVHISQRYEANEKELLKNARKYFKNTEIPKDLDRVYL